MGRYHVDNRFAGTQQNLATTFKTLAAVWSVTTGLSRGRAVALQVGADGAPNATDCQIVYAVERMTADGTGTAATPAPLDPGDVASRKTSKANYTAEGTYATIIWSRSINQRASMQWAAQDNDAMLMWAATNLVGLVLLGLSPTYAAPALGGIDFDDL